MVLTGKSLFLVLVLVLGDQNRGSEKERKSPDTKAQKTPGNTQKNPLSPSPSLNFSSRRAAVVTVDRDSSVVYCGSQICRLGTENIGAECENLKVVCALFVLCYLLA